MLSELRRGIPKSMESKERLFWNGRVGFDFIFVEERDERGVTKRVPYLVEINGSDSGFGMMRMPKGSVSKLRQIFANIVGYSRVSESELYERWTDHIVEHHKMKDLASTLIRKDSLSKEDMLDYMIQMSNVQATAKIKNRNTKHSIANPTLVDLLVNNKLFQTSLFHGFKHPRLYVGCLQLPIEKWDSVLGNPEEKAFCLKSRTGKWIVKPVQGHQGQAVEIVGDEEYEDRNFNDYELTSKIMRIYHEKYGDEYKWEDLIVEEFLTATGAESLKGSELENHPASLRLLLDFSVVSDEDGKFRVKTTYCDGIQRVSPTVGNTESAIVNISRGALTRKATDSEMEATYHIALQIVERINHRFISALNDEADRLLKMQTEITESGI